MISSSTLKYMCSSFGMNIEVRSGSQFHNFFHYPEHKIMLVKYKLNQYKVCFWFFILNILLKYRPHIHLVLEISLFLVISKFAYLLLTNIVSQKLGCQAFICQTIIRDLFSH